jgi:RimJ/RimL family protein N-acetyltransferase
MTPSVRLVALSAQAIRDLTEGRTATVDGVAIAWPEHDRRVLGYRRHALTLDPGAAPYLLHVLLDGATVAGRIGCHEGPRDGTVEIGYAVVPDYRGRGVATDMVREFVGWLAGQGVRTVRASVSPDNVASRALLDRFGFVEVGSHLDDEDGPELELELRISGSGPVAAR